MGEGRDREGGGKRLGPQRPLFLTLKSPLITLSLQGVTSERVSFPLGHGSQSVL